MRHGRWSMLVLLGVTVTASATADVAVKYTVMEDR